MSEQQLAVPGLTQRVDVDGFLRLTFDRPGEKVNLLNEEILTAIRDLMEEARRREDIRGVLFTSAKPGVFVAGMDVEQIATVNDATRAAEGSRLGQSVFQQIEDLGKPSACAIRGTCLGGGTELALACTFRVAIDDDQLKIGLPEVKLGIIPGFGGTQRLPRLVGLTAALDPILTGRMLNGRKARRMGLVDLLVPEAYLEREALRLLARAASEGASRVTAGLRKKRPWHLRMVEDVAPLRKFVLDQARKNVAKKASPENYPAPFRALEAVDAAFGLPASEGYDVEARILGELVPTPTSKNLIWLFRSQTALKGDAGQAAPRRVKRAAVLGAGIMGGGIAQLVADRGIPVRLRDLNYEAILTALATARGVWNYKVKKKSMTPAELDRKMAFIAPTLNLTGLNTVDLVVEAVVERLEVKRQVLAEAEQRLDERAVFATNTSSIPIGDIAARAHYPERVVGLHFFNPVHRMPLVEIIAGRRTSPEAVATVHALATRLGKTPVVVQDGPGFLVNRILTFYLNEAMQLLNEGVRIEAVDRAMVAFGMPMGPFELLDQIGLDTARHVGEVLQEAFGERVGAGAEAVIQAVLGDERLGKKNGRGFYTYRRGKRTLPDSGIYSLIGDPPPRDLPPETVQERLILTMINEAAVCLQDELVRHPRDIDMAMIMGTGFPPFRGGLLRHADMIGVPIVADRLARLADAHGERFRPAPLWSERVREQRQFYP